MSNAIPGEAREHERVDAVRREPLRAHLLERGGALDWLIRGNLADRPRDHRHLNDAAAAQNVLLLLCGTRARVHWRTP
jgi:hypothetical protein